MSVLIDTNVMLDVALNREPFVKTSALALGKARRSGAAVLCATSVTTLHYFLRKSLGEAGARQFIGSCLKAMPIADVTHAALQGALVNPMNDFEDGVIAQAAHAAGVRTIVSRDWKDFAQGPVPALSPEDYLRLP